MIRFRPIQSFWLVFLLLLPCSLEAQQPAKFTPPDDVSYRTDDIMSEGVRMAAEVFAPKDP